MPNGSFCVDRQRVLQLTVDFNFGDNVPTWHCVPLSRPELTVPLMRNIVRDEHRFPHLVVVCHLETIVQLFGNRV